MKSYKPTLYRIIILCLLISIGLSHTEAIYAQDFKCKPKEIPKETRRKINSIKQAITAEAKVKAIDELKAHQASRIFCALPPVIKVMKRGNKKVQKSALEFINAVSREYAILGGQGVKQIAGEAVTEVVRRTKDHKIRIMGIESLYLMCDESNLKKLSQNQNYGNSAELYLQFLYQKIFQSQYHQKAERIIASNKLAHFPVKQDWAQTFIKGLHFKDPDLRKAAAAALLNQGKQDGKFVARQLINDIAPDNFLAEAVVLQRLEGQAIPELKQMLNDVDHLTRYKAIKLLEIFGQEIIHLLPELKQIAERDVRQELREAADTLILKTNLRKDMPAHEIVSPYTSLLYVIAPESQARWIKTKLTETTSIDLDIVFKYLPNDFNIGDLAFVLYDNGKEKLRMAKVNDNDFTIKDLEPGHYYFKIISLNGFVWKEQVTVEFDFYSN